MHESTTLVLATTLSLGLAVVIAGAYLLGGAITALIGRTISRRAQRAVEALVGAAFARFEPLVRAVRTLAEAIAVLVAVIRGVADNR
jgi:hypothetical protein